MIEALGPKTNPSIKDQDTIIFFYSLYLQAENKSQSHALRATQSDKEAQMMR
jgi:hypothetical protein